MEGKLIQLLALNNTLLYFLPFHILGLMTFSFINKDFFYKTRPVFIILTALLTATFPFFVKQYQLLLPFIGIFSSAFAVNATLSLKTAKKPLFTALLGFIMASLLQFSLCFIAKTNTYIMFVTASLLPLFSLKAYPDIEDGFSDNNDHLIYSPFVFFFYMVGGIMYSFNMPKYLNACIFQGFELFYYIFAILIGFMLIKIDKIFSIFLGIVCGLISLSLFKTENTFFVNTSMIFLQAAFGFVEIFLISIIILKKDSIKAISIIFASMCLGILSGTVMTLYLQEYTDIIATYGNISLVISIVILFLVERKTQKVSAKSKEVEDLNKPPVIEFSEKTDKSEEISFKLPENSYVKALKKRLSEKEFAVLELVLQKKTYKEVATILGISESTVKTYVRRIYEKENVKGIDKLIEKIYR